MSGDHHGTFPGLRCDFSRLTWQRVKEVAWNPNDRRFFTPIAFGWGLSINFYDLY